MIEMRVEVAIIIIIIIILISFPSYGPSIAITLLAGVANQLLVAWEVAEV